MWISKFIEWIFPQDIKCIFCGDEIKTPNIYNTCDKCLKNLPFNNKKICKVCGTKINNMAKICNLCFENPPPYKIARAPFLYENPVTSIIYQIKFNNAKFLFEPLSNFLVDIYKKYNYNCDLILPIPLSQERLKTRKYNQAEKLAECLSPKLNLPVYNNLIIRTKNTQVQAKLTFENRKNNLNNAFKLLDKTKLKNKNILVIDDVITTGATINNFCLELKKAKPKNIYILTLAHTDLFRTKIKKKINFKIYLSKKIKKIKLKLQKYKKI